MHVSPTVVAVVVTLRRRTRSRHSDIIGDVRLAVGPLMAYDPIRNEVLLERLHEEALRFSSKSLSLMNGGIRRNGYMFLVRRADFSKISPSKFCQWTAVVL